MIKNSKKRKKCMFYLLLTLLGVILFLRVKSCREKLPKVKSEKPKNKRKNHSHISSCYLHGLIFFSFGAIPSSRLWHSLMRHSPPKLLKKMSVSE